MVHNISLVIDSLRLSDSGLYLCDRHNWSLVVFDVSIIAGWFAYTQIPLVRFVVDLSTVLSMHKA